MCPGGQSVLVRALCQFLNHRPVGLQPALWVVVATLVPVGTLLPVGTRRGQRFRQQGRHPQEVVKTRPVSAQRVFRRHESEKRHKVSGNLQISND